VAAVFSACRWRSNTESIERFIMAGAPVCDRLKPAGGMRSAVSVPQ
jgi:hypothetical protein